jgi:uncharacterized damage-inducible protein DinB
MATTADLLIDGFGRIRENVSSVLDGLNPSQATYCPEPGANPVSWLVWHLTRVQDDHVAGAFGTPQVWSTGGWAAKFGVPSDAPLLAGYHEAVHAQTVALVSAVTDADLDRVVDTRWTPHVTLGVRLVSVLDDDMQHAGAAAYLRGIIERGK